MNGVNKTLYIPLYGKAYVSRRALFLDDKRAEEIWAAEGFALKGKSRSRWLAYYMGIRSAVFDNWLREQISSGDDAVVIHIGCGLDSRVLRVGGDVKWYDVDFPEVIAERGRYYTESNRYRMLAGDARDGEWLANIPEHSRAIVVMEGVSMYLTSEQIPVLLERLSAHFEHISILMDAYTSFAARMSKYKNPINDVGVTQVYGIDDPCALECCGIAFLGERDMTPQKYVDELSGIEKQVFKRLYAGGLAKKLYRLYEYEK